MTDKEKLMDVVNKSLLDIKNQLLESETMIFPLMGYSEIKDFTIVINITKTIQNGV